MATASRRVRAFSNTRSTFEVRLAAAKAIRPGPGVLVFCGSGFAWRLSDLEDFADFYRTAVHRADDPFALNTTWMRRGCSSCGTWITSPS
jgi:hypothetical protein